MSELALYNLSLPDLVALSPTAEAFEEHLVQSPLDEEEGEPLLDAFLHDDFHGALRVASPEVADSLRRRVALLREQKTISGDPKRKGAYAAKLLVAEAFRGLNGEWHGLRAQQKPRALKWALIACIARLKEALEEERPISRMEVTGIARFLGEIESAKPAGTAQSMALAKMLLLLARLHAFEPRLVRDYRESLDTSSAEMLLTKLADIFAGFLRLASADLSKADGERLGQVARLGPSARAFEAFFPWAQALFPNEWQGFKTRLAEHGYEAKLGNLIRLLDSRVRLARTRLSPSR